MFNNIGGKIKVLAQVICWLGIIGSVIGGFAMIAMFIDYDDLAIFYGLIIAAVGSLVSWLSSFMLYGMGQLIQNSDKLVQMKENEIYSNGNPTGYYPQQNMGYTPNSNTAGYTEYTPAFDYDHQQPVAAPVATQVAAPVAHEAAPQQIICPSCNAVMSPNNKFCTNCGQGLSNN